MIYASNSEYKVKKLKTYRRNTSTLPTESNTPEIKKQYVCQYCGKSYARKSWYDKHKCKKKEIFETKTNLDLIITLKLYNHWLRRSSFLKKKSKDKTTEELVESRYNKYFFDLNAFSKENFVISPFKYLDWLIDNRIQTKYWCTQDALLYYREHIIENDTPENQVKMSLKYVEGWCLDNNVDPINFFSTIMPVKAVEMILDGELSPWFLLASDASQKDLIPRFTDQHLHEIDEKINVEYWLQKLDEQQEIVENMNNYINNALYYRISSE